MILIGKHTKSDGFRGVMITSGKIYHARETRTDPSTGFIYYYVLDDSNEEHWYNFNWFLSKDKTIAFLRNKRLEEIGI